MRIMHVTCTIYLYVPVATPISKNAKLIKTLERKSTKIYRDRTRTAFRRQHDYYWSKSFSVFFFDLALKRFLCIIFSIIENPKPEPHSARVGGSGIPVSDCFMCCWIYFLLYISGRGREVRWACRRSDSGGRRDTVFELATTTAAGDVVRHRLRVQQVRHTHKTHIYVS